MYGGADHAGRPAKRSTTQPELTPMSDTPRAPEEERPSYWYLTTTTYCPLCNATHRTRERMPTPRPSDYEARNPIVETYDYCNV
jgi:hypothetical protein